MSPRPCRLLPQGTSQGHQTDQHTAEWHPTVRWPSPLPSACAARAGGQPQAAQDASPGLDGLLVSADRYACAASADRSNVWVG